MAEVHAIVLHDVSDVLEPTNLVAVLLVAETEELAVRVETRSSGHGWREDGREAGAPKFVGACELFLSGVEGSSHWGGDMVERGVIHNILAKDVIIPLKVGEEGFIIRNFVGGKAVELVKKDGWDW